MLTNNKCSRSVSNPTSYGMKCVLDAVTKTPGLPLLIADIQHKYNLRRNDMIHIRRQLIKIDHVKGPIRFIEPARKHIVYIDPVITDEKEIVSIMAAASAIIHLNSKIKQINNAEKNAILEKKLSDYIYQLI